MSLVVVQVSALQRPACGLIAYQFTTTAIQSCKSRSELPKENIGIEI